MASFLNSEIAAEEISRAQAEEAAARENQQSAELLDALGRIAELNMKLLAMVEVMSELAVENARLRVESKINHEKHEIHESAVEDSQHEKGKANG